MANKVLNYWKGASGDGFDLLFETAPIMMHSIDAEGVLLRVSTFWAGKLGYPPEDLTGRPLVDFMTEKSRKYALDTNLLRNEARYHALLGDADRAIGYLEQAADQNLYFSVPLHTIWPELEPLRGDPRYEALLTRLHEKTEAERAELGLEPLNT